MVSKPPTLIEDIDAFLARHGMAPVTFGRRAMNDPHFMRDLRNGRRLFRETEDKIRTFMDEYQPADTADSPDDPPPFPNRPRRTVDPVPGTPSTLPTPKAVVRVSDPIDANLMRTSSDSHNASSIGLSGKTKRTDASRERAA